jgi:CheY-like chemotaxis protein
MFSRESLLAVPEIKLAGKNALTSEGQFGIYAQTLNKFIDSLPAQTDQLRANFDAGKTAALYQNITDIIIALKGIYAEDMATKCRNQFDTLDKSDEDALEAFIENLIQSAGALSIDIQMATHSKAASRKQPGAAPPPAQAAPGAGRRNLPVILAVDNAIMFLNTMKKLLADAPYELHCVTSGDQALSFIQAARPDVFLLDIEMPDMDGYQLARRIKDSGQRAPIIFITANSARECVDRAIDVGAAGLLMKPLRVNQLLSKLKEFV